MSCNNPVPSLLLSPVLHAKAVQELQVLFQTKLTWIENIYACAMVGVAKTNKGNFNYPRIYSGSGGKYFDVRPDNSLRAYSFFEVNNSFPVDTEEDQVVYDLSFICWYNLPKLNGEKSYDYSPELISHVLKVIKESDYDSRISNKNVFVNPEDVFSRYSMDQSDTQHLMYPYGAFKITFDFTVNVEADCFEAFTQGAEGCGIFNDGASFNSDFSDDFDI